MPPDERVLRGAQLPGARTSVLATALAVAAGAAVQPALGAVPSAGIFLLSCLAACLAVRTEGGAGEPPGGLGGRVVLAGTAVVLIGMTARAAGSLFLAHPAAVWGVGAAAAAVLLGGLLRLGRWAGLVGVLALAGGVAGGLKFERSGPQAKGAAVSGPLYGIHPFQTTAVRIDGYGPFDVPLNDYVEPGAHRGYGPEELADALALALHRIAELHFAEGPARAYQAFARAEVEPVRTYAVAERLDRGPSVRTQPRFVVRSGTFGPGSKVEFVCPGARNDPRGFRPVPPTTKMCPDKYAVEASAGIGVTGRWAGYAEFRGAARTSLAALVGATGTDEAPDGRRVRRVEALVWGLLVAFVATVAAFRRPTTDAAVGIAEGGGVLVLLVLAGAVGSLHPVVPAAVFAPAEGGPGALVGAFVPAFAVAAGAGLGAAAAHGAVRNVGRRELVRHVALPIAIVAVATAGAAVDPAWAFELAPWPGAEAAGTATAWVEALAGRAALATGLDVQATEALLAAAVLTLWLGAGTICLGTACAGLGRPSGTKGAWGVAGLGLAGALLGAFAPRAEGGLALAGAVCGAGLVLAVQGAAAFGARGSGWLWPAAFLLPLAGLAGSAADSPVTWAGMAAAWGVVAVALWTGRRGVAGRSDTSSAG